MNIPKEFLYENCGKDVLSTWLIYNDHHIPV